MPYIHYCAHCGKRGTCSQECKTQYCKSCSTIEGRARLDREQEELEKERNLILNRVATNA